VYIWDSKKARIFWLPEVRLPLQEGQCSMKFIVWLDLGSPGKSPGCTVFWDVKPVGWWKITKEPTASNFRMDARKLYSPEDEGKRFLRNIRKLLPGYMVALPRIPNSSTFALDVSCLINYLVERKKWVSVQQIPANWYCLAVTYIGCVGYSSHKACDNHNLQIV